MIRPFIQASAPLTARKELEGHWQSMSSAPKDRPILAWCDHEADPFIEGTQSNGDSYLTLYAAHAEGLSHAGTGLKIVVWGGGFDDSTWEAPGSNLPDWWFVIDSEFEVAANPICWMPAPEAPSGVQKAAFIEEMGASRDKECAPAQPIDVDSLFT